MSAEECLLGCRGREVSKHVSRLSRSDEEFHTPKMKTSLGKMCVFTSHVMTSYGSEVKVQRHDRDRWEIRGCIAIHVRRKLRCFARMQVRPLQTQKDSMLFGTLKISTRDRPISRAQLNLQILSPNELPQLFRLCPHLPRHFSWPILSNELLQSRQPFQPVPRPVFVRHDSPV
jgi:hypothetical protein